MENSIVQFRYQALAPTLALEEFSYDNSGKLTQPDSSHHYPRQTSQKIIKTRQQTANNRFMLMEIWKDLTAINLQN